MQKQSWPIAERLKWKYLYRIVKPYTLVSHDRAKSLYELTLNLEWFHIPGDYVECGVYHGGTAAILAYSASHSKITRHVWLFDSFNGMPQITKEDGESAQEYVGDVVGSIDKVNTVLGNVRADRDHVHIVKGWFLDTFSKVNIPQIALLNIDADWYESVKLCLEKFYDAVVPGGIISIDDYGHWPGCKKAVDQFFSSRELTVKLHAVDYTAHWFQKE